MSGDAAREVKVELAEGVKGDIAELTALPTDADSKQREDVEVLKRRIAELFLECEDNPHAGDLMGAGRHSELADCRRIRFDIDGFKGKPRFRLIYRNEPSDGARRDACGLRSDLGLVCMLIAKLVSVHSEMTSVRRKAQAEMALRTVKGSNEC